MTDSVARLRQQIASAQELAGVVRSMKAMAVSSIGQYEQAVCSLDDYYQTIEQGLSACFKIHASCIRAPILKGPHTTAIGVIVFGSDQGLVGKFNHLMVEYVAQTLKRHQTKKIIWTVGERLNEHLHIAGFNVNGSFTLPNSINEINRLVAEVLEVIEQQTVQGLIKQVYLFHHRPDNSRVYRPVSQLLLPLDYTWQQRLAQMAWPTHSLAQVIPLADDTLRGCVGEYLFVSLFRACALSLASENSSRLAAMQRAENNIDQLQSELTRRFHHLRQQGIDEELFDLIAGFEALINQK